MPPFTLMPVTHALRFILELIQTYWLVITCLLFVAIATLSLTPAPELPPAPGNDKTQHLIAYGALMFPTALRRPKHWIWLGLLYIGLSGAIELIQPLANRHKELADLAANILGILCGTAAGWGLSKLCRKA